MDSYVKAVLLTRIIISAKQKYKYEDTKGVNKIYSRRQ